ncbi:hypothetical protein AwWohl_10460 [Gammaproteobacteria bacterium]|nr:hypothetical protein AwWohl_10460 [Gammaproteobacteria bacterium]
MLSSFNDYVLIMSAVGMIIMMIIPIFLGWFFWKKSGAKAGEK